jgi:hypothetical protein
MQNSYQKIQKGNGLILKTIYQQVVVIGGKEALYWENFCLFLEDRMMSTGHLPSSAAWKARKESATRRH